MKVICLWFAFVIFRILFSPVVLPITLFIYLTGFGDVKFDSFAKFLEHYGNK